MKKTILSVLVISLISFASANPYWTEYKRINRLQTLVNGEVWIILEDNPEWFGLKALTEDEKEGVLRIHKVLLEAETKNRSVKLLIDGTVPIFGQNPYPRIISVELVNNR